MVRRILVTLAALSVCALAHGQSAPSTHDSTAAQDSKVSPASAGKAEAAGKPDVAGKAAHTQKAVVAVKPDAASKPELEDVKPQPSPAASPLVFKNTGPVSTEDVVRGVAKELAKQEAGEADGLTANPSSTKAQSGTASTAKGAAQNPGQGPAAASDAVMEFQPASSGTGAASSATVIEDGAQSKSPLKRVHGDLYGVAGGAGHAAGGSVGATSKSGKTSVYIQSDEARSKAGQPQ